MIFFVIMIAVNLGRVCQRWRLCHIMRCVVKRLVFYTLILAVFSVFVASACEDEITGGVVEDGGVCGNALLEFGEDCDDGNRVSGDGCSVSCRLEEGWRCDRVGEPCERLASGDRCGNRVVDPEFFENCDDGNAISGDGCSSVCQVEEGYSCPVPGQACVQLTKCGNGLLDEGEDCDDSNSVSGDGCSESCELEDGWNCPYVGFACAKKECGDGIVDEGEECDDGFFNSDEPYGLHCMKNCHFAPRCGDGRVDAGYEACDDGVNTGGYNGCKSDCSAIERYCGDGLRTDGEACDDMNTRDGDGCSATCEVEAGWFCPLTGSCVKSLCGNGELDAGETCDDDNRVSEDGCSSFCRVEPGYVCKTPGQRCAPIPCGTGTIEDGDGKQCDDGNTVSGDGCDEFCRLEAGWICSQPGKPCYARNCGDGIVAAGEECDDANRNSGDGCSDRCQIEDGYHCPTAGKPCVKGSCGNGIIDGGETCDTGSIVSAGCVDCRLQEGWKCELAGADCEEIKCGDGVVEGLEECDDGGTNNGDGCSSLCKVELGWRCPVPGAPCVKGFCGDGQIDAGEQCDDGNLQAGDGCSPLCETEPIFICKDGQCKPVCGDGITMWEAGEECDDGNTISGDGCDSQCRVEDGFACTDFSGPPPTTLNLPIVYRDFVRYNNNQVSTPTNGYLTQAIYNSLPANCKGDNGYRAQYFPEVGRPSPDFYSYCPASRCIGAVLEDLGADGTPDLAPAAQIKADPSLSPDILCHYLYTCPTMFKWWFQDVPGINITIPSVLSLSQSTTDPGTYSYSNASFYPINNAGYGPAGSNGSVNGEFTSAFQSYFKYKGGEVLTFDGDDDVWVFFNHKLGVDVGGIHPRWEKSITLDSATAASKFKMFPGGIYPMHMFHAERCTGGSSFRLTLSGFLNMGTSSCNAICGDGLIRGAEECDAGEDNGKPESGCSRDCKIVPYCGNGKVEFPEACDDGAENGQPGKCPAHCIYENCNNNRLDDGEECDPSVPASIPEGKYCLQTCRFSRCGDNYIDKRLDEECDDGNTDDSDMCTSLCKLPVCGDGIVSAHLGEVCDDGVNDGSYNGCGFGCSYIPPRCGDAIVDTQHGEQCDDGINDSVYGGCAASCKLAPYCGDGVVDEPYEACDDGNDIDNDACNNYCHINVN